MKLRNLAIVLTAGVVTITSCEQKNETKQVVLSNNIDSVSYAIGMNSANGLKQQFPEVNSEAFLAGFRNSMDSTNDLLLSKEENQAILQAFSQKKQAEQMAEQQKQLESIYAEVKQNGLAFLEANKQTEGVQITPSGLQYIVLKEGTGKQATRTSDVTVHYHGTTPDGTVFDSSVERGETISFNLGQVIPGWTEGVSLMKEGAKYKFFIPQELAYGANAPQGGQGPIKPFMPLVFEVELFEVK